MELLLIRHGEALPLGAPGIKSDEQRVLSPAGRSKIRHTAIALDKLEVRVSLMLASPLARAMETAEIICEHLTNPPQLRACDALRPGFDRQAVIQQVRDVADLGALALCAHEPDLSRLATLLMGGHDQPCIVFHTGAVAHMQLDLKVDPPAAVLHWFLNSRHMELIAGPS